MCVWVKLRSQIDASGMWHWPRHEHHHHTSVNLKRGPWRFQSCQPLEIHGKTSLIVFARYFGQYVSEMTFWTIPSHKRYREDELWVILRGVNTEFNCYGSISGDFTKPQARLPLSSEEGQQMAGDFQQFPARTNSLLHDWVLWIELSKALALLSGFCIARCSLD